MWTDLIFGTMSELDYLFIFVDLKIFSEIIASGDGMISHYWIDVYGNGSHEVSITL
jgi:hypothetical protein